MISGRIYSAGGHCGDHLSILWRTDRDFVELRQVEIMGGDQDSSKATRIRSILQAM